jgi:hypothetical protein
MASLECAHEYQNALEEGPVRPGDLLNVPAGFLNKRWVEKHGMPTSTVVVATVVRVQADGGQAGVSAVIEHCVPAFCWALFRVCSSLVPSGCVYFFLRKYVLAPT